MKNMTVADAAEYFGISKEAIHNRIRRGSLESIIENGIKLVVVDEVTTASSKPLRKVAQGVDERYYKLLEEQNAKLQERVERLENETQTLREQKEKMLINERIMIENIYKEKDEQLKNILNSFQAQFMLSSPQEPEHLDAEIEEVKNIEIQESIVSLKKYLKEQNISEKKAKKIKEKFKKSAKKDERIIIVGKKYYLNLDKYDYKDLL